MDADTTRRKDDHEKILSAFLAQEADILIGTQMIVKGHDFPNVTLVGVIAADLSLNVGDYQGFRAYISASYTGSWACRAWQVCRGSGDSDISAGTL